MKKAFFWALVIGLSGLPALGMASMPGDSIGTKIVNGKAYILYKISKGDNLSQISRTYGSSVANIQELNKIQGGNIQIGQVLMIPSRGGAKNLSLKDVSSTPIKPVAKPVAVSKPSTVTAPQNPLSNAKGGDRKSHIVAKGETLYALSRKYSVSVAQIKEWNGLTSDGLAEGQKLYVSKLILPQTASTNVEKPKPTAGEQPKPVVEDAAKPKPTTDTEAIAAVKKADETPKEKPNSKPVVEATAPKAKTVSEPIEPKIQRNPGVHVVKTGETLFGIARTYGMDVRDLKKINRLENATIAEGQQLRVKADTPSNPNQGISLAEMLETASDTTPKLEAYPDLTVITVPKETAVAKTAKVEVYKDKSSGKNFKRVEEEGTVGRIEDYSTDQTRFYVFHRNLPVGSYLRVDYPEKGQSILVEVISKLPEQDKNVVRLTAKCMDYLMIRDNDQEVRLRYVIPFGE